MADLPSESREQFPMSLSGKTKKLLLKSDKKPTELAKVIETVVNKINHGPVDSIEMLVAALLEE